MECKFYAALQIALARGFIGLTTDLATKDRFFVTNTSQSNLERLLTRHSRSWASNAIPHQPIATNRLRSLFEEAFIRYLARS